MSRITLEYHSQQEVGQFSSHPLVFQLWFLPDLLQYLSGAITVGILAIIIPPLLILKSWWVVIMSPLIAKIATKISPVPIIPGSTIPVPISIVSILIVGVAAVILAGGSGFAILMVGLSILRTLTLLPSWCPISFPKIAPVALVLILGALVKLLHLLCNHILPYCELFQF